MGLLVYGRVVKSSRVHFGALWCTAGGMFSSVGRRLAAAVRLRFAHPTTALRLWFPRSRGRGRPRAPAVPAHRPPVRPSLFSRTEMGLLVYGRVVKSSRVHFGASWCTAERLAVLVYTRGAYYVRDKGEKGGRCLPGRKGWGLETFPG